MTSTKDTATPRLSRRARWALVGILLLMGVGSAVAAEMFIRYREVTRETVPGTFPTLYYKHGRLRHAHVRDFDYFGWIHINRLGFRGPEFEVDPEPGTIRVMAVGGSTTFDRGVTADSLAWPAQLESRLNALGTGAEYEVINAGTSGYTVLDNLIRLQTELHEYRPDVIILYHAHNDLFGALNRDPTVPLDAFERPGEVDALTPWGRWLSRNSLFYGKVVGRIGVIRRLGGGGGGDGGEARPFPTVAVRIEAGRERFERDLRGFLALAEQLGIPVVLPEVVHVSGAGSVGADERAAWLNAVVTADATEVVEGYAVLNRSIRAIAEEAEACHVPTQGFGLEGWDYYEPEDPIHFNDAGASRMADMLAGALMACEGFPGAPGSS